MVPVGNPRPVSVSSSDWARVVAPNGTGHYSTPFDLCNRGTKARHPVIVVPKRPLAEVLPGRFTVA